MIHKPLDRFELFRSDDLDFTRDKVAAIYCAHGITLIGREPRLNTWMNSTRLDNIGLSYITYGEAVKVEPEALGTFYVIEIPLAGRGLLHYGKQTAYASSGVAVVLGPTVPPVMRLEAELELLILRVERTALEVTLADLLDRSLPKLIEFSLTMDITTGYARTWADYLLFCAAELNRPDSLLSHPLSIQQMEQNLMSGLLLAQPSNYTATLQGKTLPAPSRVIARAVDVIETHPEQAHTMGSLAREVGVSVRALQKGFRRHLDTTPSAFLREVRLRRVHDELKAAQSDSATVGAVAGRWGFAHLGRFASSYRRQFNETPSQTLHG